LAGVENKTQIQADLLRDIPWWRLFCIQLHALAGSNTDSSYLVRFVVLGYAMDS